MGHFSSQSSALLLSGKCCVALRWRHLSRLTPTQLCWPPRGSSAEGSARCVPSAPSPHRQLPLLGMGKKQIKLLTDTLHTDTLERRGSACASNCCEDEKHLVPVFRLKIAKYLNDYRPVIPQMIKSICKCVSSVPLGANLNVRAEKTLNIQINIDTRAIKE